MLIAHIDTDISRPILKFIRKQIQKRRRIVRGRAPLYFNDWFFVVFYPINGYAVGNLSTFLADSGVTLI